MTRVFLLASLLSLYASTAAGQAVKDREIASERLSLARALVHHAGEVYVVDQAPEILVFDEHGEYRRTIGQRGNGPGEFVAVARIGLKGDTLWVYDRQVGRISHFFGGSYVRETRVALSGDLVETVLSDGSLLVAGMEHWHQISLGVQQNLPVTRNPQGAGTFTKLFDRSVDGMIIHFNPSNNPRDQGGVFYPNPFGRHEILRPRVDGSGFFLINLGSYEVTLHDATGAVTWSRQIATTPQRSTGRIRNNAVESIFDPLREHATGIGWASEAAMRQAIERALPDVTHLPPVTDAVSGSGGALWIRRELTDSATIRWDILDARGTVVRSTNLPVTFEGRFAEGTRAIWGTVTDEFDVPTIIRYRVD